MECVTLWEPSPGAGLKGRRRDTAMMLCVLAAVFALLTAVLCYQQSGSRAMEVQRQDLYGAWQLAVTT